MADTDYSAKIAGELNLKSWQIENTLKLLEEGSTIPFISRYRKEATGELDEISVSGIKEMREKLIEVDKRRESILKEIAKQEKLTDELDERIKKAESLIELEDLYLPYKPKKKTRAAAAREKGLENLAKMIFEQNHAVDIVAEALFFINEDVKTIEEALQGARDIIAEWISEDKTAREKIRKLFSEKSVITSKLIKDREKEGINYRDYFEFQQDLDRCPSHRLLAIRRGENEGFLKVSIEVPEEDAIYMLESLFLKKNSGSIYSKAAKLTIGGDSAAAKSRPEDSALYNSTAGSSAEQVKISLEDSYKRLIKPSIENEFARSSREKADDEAIKVFTENLRQLLMAPVLGGKRVLALDPGFRTGCKVVCLNGQGDLLLNDTIYPHPPVNKTGEAAAIMKKLVEEYNIEAIAIGNGTASRETRAFVEGIDFGKTVQVFIVNESGASIYSTSKAAREEFPQFDATVRGTISIGRRLIDPLAELVKISPKSLGVGQYQYDVDQKKLQESLDRVVESCVNLVGVNLNTASYHLLNYVSGLGPVLALNIINYRTEKGAFKSRSDLLGIPRMGAKVFEQCAGFLRIPDGLNQLDNSAVHPESYHIVEEMARDLESSVKNLIENKSLRSEIRIEKYVSGDIGLPTLKDIMEELARPGRDPRKMVSVFEFKKDINTIEDLQPGMILPGIITNVTNFGAFVDIGIKQGGLIHISELSDSFVSNPNDVVSVHQEVKAKVINIDLERGRIQLSLKESGS